MSRALNTYVRGGAVALAVALEVALEVAGKLTGTAAVHPSPNGGEANE